MRVLVVGSGGREHALCWALKRTSPGVELLCAPGNVGIAELAELVPVGAGEVERLGALASERSADLTVVGPEVPLALGIADEFERRGLRLFGPSRAAARLESSKTFAKAFMQRHGIPTADSETVASAAEAEAAARRVGLPLVLKADGLAAGKGVLIVRDEASLAAALDVFFAERRFGASAKNVLVEPFLEGEEVSFIGLSDGKSLLPLATSKDYKRIGDGDTGPNTGGMGAHSPAGVLSPEETSQIVDRVMLPAVAGMAAEGSPFVGVLYAGLMLTAEGARVLEFNVRLGDPEAQALLVRLEDDLAEILEAGAAGAFGADRIAFRPEAGVCLVLASAGYPDEPRKGDVIDGLDGDFGTGVEVFHAGTARSDGEIVTAGGRVLNVCATGAGLAEALERAYAAAGRIRWSGRQLRGDIGRRVIERQASSRV